MIIATSIFLLLFDRGRFTRPPVGKSSALNNEQIDRVRRQEAGQTRNRVTANDESVFFPSFL